MASSDYVNQVQQLYIAYFDRPADQPGLQYWTLVVDAARGSLTSVIDGFAASAESQTLFGGKTPADKVTAIYQNLFGRAPEPAGLAYWTTLLSGGTVSASQVALAVLQGAQGSDATTVSNKLTVAKAFTTAMDTAAEMAGYKTADAAASARSFLGRVTASSSSVNTLLGEVDTAVATATGTTPPTPPEPPGPSFTASKDGANAVTFSGAGATITATFASGTYTFTSGNTATISGTVASISVPAGTVLTLASAVASGLGFPGAGTVKLSDTTASAATLKAIEATTTGLLDASSVTAISAAPVADALLLLVTNNGSSGDKIKTAANVAVTLTGTTATAANLKAIEAATAGLVDASSVTTITTAPVADALLLLVTNNGSSGDKVKTAANVAVTLSGTTATAANLKAIEAATTGLVDASTVTSITSASAADAVLLLATNNGSTGDKIKTAANVAVTLSDTTATAANLKATEAATTGLVDASSVTSITAAPLADALLLLVTNNGSSGDKIQTAASVGLTLSDTTASAADLKALEAATTGLVDASSVTSITAASVADAVLLLVTNNGGSGDKIQTAANVAVTLSDTTASAQDLNSLDAATTGLVAASTLASLSGTVSDMKTALEAITTGTQLSAANLGSVTLTDVIDIPASNMFANVTFSNNTTLTLANVASNTLSLGGSTVAAGKVLTIDGSALASGFSVDGSGLDSGSLVFLGGSGSDTLGGSPRADTFTGGGGDDVYAYYPSNQSTPSAMDTITDYRTAGNDVINTSAFTAVMGSATNQVQDLSAQATLADASNVAANGNTSNHGLMVFIWGGDTYVAVEHTGSGSTLAAGDFIVKLSGTPFAAGTNIGTLGLFGVT